MLLMQDPKLLLLDEPVAGMTDEETERTARALLVTLKGKHSLMVVEHDMSFYPHHFSDIVTVLCDGSVLAAGHAGPGAGR